MKAFAELWADYQRLCVPGDARPYQVEQTKQAFYAGALACFLAITHLDPTTPEATEGDLKYIDSIHNELQTYAKERAYGALQRAAERKGQQA